MCAVERPLFQDQQFRFTAYLRDPEATPLPEGVEARRMAIYRELVYNNIAGFLESALPVLQQLSDEKLWHHRIRQFLVHHRARSPYFADIPREFVQFLQEDYRPLPEDPPFLAELAHYEWVELALSIHEADSPPCERPANTPITELPLRPSPLAWLLEYRWPVHRIGPDWQPELPPEQPTWLVVWRDRKDEVRFLELNAPSARLMALLAELPPDTLARQAVRQLSAELRHPDPEALRRFAAELLEDWWSRELLTLSR